jgi:hypothetical protein
MRPGATPYYHILGHTPANREHGDLLSIAPQGYTQVASGASGGLNLPGGPFISPVVPDSGEALTR